MERFWLIDSGCYRYMTGDRRWFSSVTLVMTKEYITFGDNGKGRMSYGPPWAHYLDGYHDRLLGGPLGLLDLRCTAPDGVKHKDYRGEVLG
jgi:hypothetical protein